MDNLVSICIPVYNSENTIKSTIESALSQTYKNVELVIVDNASTDKTWDIINGFDDARIKKYRNNTNIGMVGNWNKCLEYATGKYIHFLCGDDIIFSSCIAKKVALAEQGENISMVFSASEIINENNDVVLTRRYLNKDAILDGKKLAKKSFLTRNIYGEPSNVLFKRELIDVVGKFADNLIYAIDLDLWLRLSACGKVGYISEPLMQYRISKSNATASFNYQKILSDDNNLIDNIKKYKCISLSTITKIVHKFMYAARFLVRIIFIKIRS